MQPVFSLNGQHVAWLIGNFVYDKVGQPIAFVSGGGLYFSSEGNIGQIFKNGEAFTWRILHSK